MEPIPVDYKKNLSGDLGERCRMCSGLGYTNSLNGRSGSCTRCDKTGIEPINTHVLQAQIDELREMLKKVILSIDANKEII